MEQSANPTPNGENGEGLPLDLSKLVKDGKILGKYDTPEAAEKGYWSSVQEMNQAKSDLNTAIQIIEALKQGQPQQRAETPDYIKKLNDVGIPMGELDQLINDRASKVAEKMVNQHLAPLVQGASARSFMATKYPDFVENENAVMSFAKNDPELSTSFDALLAVGRPKEALELGYLNWKSKAAPAKPDPATESARRAAGMPTGGGGAGRTSGMGTGPSDAELNAAYKDFLNNGDARPIFDLKFKNVPITYTEQMEALMRGRN